MAISREANLREVLAEVSVLDLWAAVKSIFGGIGCMAIFFGVAFAFSQMPPLLIGTSEGFAIPSWLIWLFTMWVFIGGYTADQSYHEHRFAWYFPKAGFLWSLPLACYFLAGIQIFRAASPEMEPLARAALFALGITWWFPFLLILSLMEIGHSRLMEKRTAQPSASEG